MSSVPPSPSAKQRSLYRRHRPRTFSDVVGQEQVVRTLRNAIEKEKVHHAYLFVGSRGTGKTSFAKILAACLNCERGPSVDPCGACDSCVSIAEARSLDVIEMDAASNNSVEDIRELRDSVAFAPLSGRTKVYILDEAHMLSTAAWNAFLKTLEEPPASTVFVLATTEAQKVPPTVVDRCHRFDFQRPSIEQIATVLRRAAEAEPIVIPDEAIAAIARAASGSFRDALGSLEQLITYSGREIALQDALAVLGVSDFELIERTLLAIAAGDVKGVFAAIEDCVSKGRDVSVLAADLESRARDLIVVQVLEQVPAELSLTPEIDEALLTEAEAMPQRLLVRLLDLLASAMEAVKAGADARTQVELALLKAAKPEADPSIRALLARVDRLEEAIGSRPHPRTPSPQATARASGGAVGQELPHPAPAEREVPHRAPAERDRAAAALTADQDRLQLISELWPGIVDLVRAGNALLGAVIADGRPIKLDDRILTVAFPHSFSFNKKKAEDPGYRAIVCEAISQLAGIDVTLRYELSEQAGELLDDRQVPEVAGREEDLVKRIIVEFEAEELPASSAERE